MALCKQPLFCNHPFAVESEPRQMLPRECTDKQ